MPRLRGEHVRRKPPTIIGCICPCRASLFISDCGSKMEMSKHCCRRHAEIMWAYYAPFSQYVLVKSEQTPFDFTEKKHKHPVVVTRASTLSASSLWHQTFYTLKLRIFLRCPYAVYAVAIACPTSVIRTASCGAYLSSAINAVPCCDRQRRLNSPTSAAL